MHRKTNYILDRTFLCKIDTLENILENVDMKDNKVNFIKMDIEGFEADVIEKSIQLIKQADIISLEFHYTKDKIDKILLHEGFLFEPITMWYIYKKTLTNLLKHLYTLLKAYIDAVAENPSVIRKGITGFDSTKGLCTTESYIKAGS